MPTGDAYPSGHLAQSHVGFAYVEFVEINPFTDVPELCTSNIPRYFLDFAWNIINDTFHNDLCSGIYLTYNMISNNDTFIVTSIIFHRKCHLQLINVATDCSRGHASLKPYINTNQRADIGNPK